ncbi:MAG: LytTR family transcriptional regulator DNA-binding domain-containing protein, partial [Oscillospiraceae bacterium]|nr:LytTR family transcriptional regulator DNA-binding domain-containing protein [Oscillospiraceae bacterium]
HKIVMIESFNHTREITLTDDSVLETSATLSELFEQLGGHENFYMPHRAYIANLDHSVGIVRYDLLMPGDRRIPIPKNQFAAVQEFVREHFFKRK